ncbi:DUF445 domain-containing protein [Paenibacillus sp. P25]|nr:DUF445 domain-containing protein [Paenibacillus sp. P25]
MRSLAELETSGFMQFALNAFIGFMNEDKMGTMIQRFILTSLDSLRMPLDPNRLALLGEVRRQLEGLPDRPELAEQAAGWLQSMGERYDVGGMALKFLENLRDKPLETVREENFAERTAIPFILELLQKARSEEAFMDRTEAFIQSQLAELIEAHHHKIGHLIRENVNKFDNETLIALLEDKIGKDLQWIRVNGAVCGFLIGIVLAGVKLLGS